MRNGSYVVLSVGKHTKEITNYVRIAKRIMSLRGNMIDHFIDIYG